MVLFESPTWDVDASAKVLSEKFGKVSRSRKKKQKQRTQAIKTSNISTSTFDQKSSKKIVKGKKKQTGHRKHEGYINAFEEPPVKTKIKGTKNQAQSVPTEAKSPNKIKKIGKKGKVHKVKKTAKTVESLTQSERSVFHNPCLNLKIKKRHSPDPVKSHSFIFKKSRGNEECKGDRAFNTDSQSKKTKSKKKFQESLMVKKKKVDFKQNLKLKRKKKRAGGNSHTEQIHPPVAADNVNLQGSLKKVIDSNVYTSHSVRENRKFKNKKQNSIEENLNHSPGETESKTSKSFASRFLKYATHKNILVSFKSNEEHLRKGSKRKCEEDLNSAQPKKKKKQEELSSKTPETSGSLRERMMDQLKSSRFRYINEKLYTTTGSNAQFMFKRDPDSFHAYHEGYKQQVAKWPMNPLDKMIKAIKKKPAKLVVADFGCGDAQLAKSLPNKVYSFDLVAISEEVTVCDMAHTPLSDCSIDIAVFCLSLMGTDLVSYIREANRVVKIGGLLKIAEVASRFENVEGFCKSLTKYGFKFQHRDLSNNLFYFMDFKKDKSIQNVKRLPPLSLKPCFYKRR